MTLENMIRAIAGTFVVISLTLGYIVSPYWHFFTAFVGLNLLQSAFTHWCFMEKILIKLNLGKPAYQRAPSAAPSQGGFITGQFPAKEVQTPPTAPPL
jgi:Inner membrane protein YgaP-like, transmembrane domain